METSSNVIMDQVTAGLGEAFLSERDQKALDWLDYFGIGFSFPPLIAAQQPNRFWAYDTELVRAAQPIPASTVTGCVSNLAQNAWSKSSQNLVLPPGTPPLFALIEPDGSHELRIPTSEIGKAIPANTRLILMLDGTSIHEAPINLALGSQEVSNSHPPGSVDNLYGRVS